MVTNCHPKTFPSLPLFQGTQTLGFSLLFPYPPRNPERNWALSEEQRREEFPPFTHPPIPTPKPHLLFPKTLFLTPCGVLLEHSPPLFPWPGLLKQRALHEKKRLVFKCFAVKGGLSQVGAEICSDSRVALLFFRDESLLEAGSVSIHY